ncbi:MAG: aconitate hydratase AcnA [Brumimicrobium sp.]|nr:aconitate hydratase AcnA [Brumimicrobium sp.]
MNSPKGDLSYYSLKELEKQGYNINKLPFSIRILLENALRNYDGFTVTKDHIEILLNWKPKGERKDIAYKPARVLMQDFTGVPAVVDIASIRAEVARKGGDASKINPLIPVDLVIDHSVQVDYFAAPYAYDENMKKEYERNNERYRFLKWAQKSFHNFRVVPPGMGICHQVNLEYLSKGITSRNGYVFPDTVIGTDSHTPMVNGIGVMSWGVGGIEAEAAILGQPVYFISPDVIGLKLIGNLPAGTTATDLVLTIANTLRKYGVVEKFVEVFGPGLTNLSVPDRATIGNMSPEFGCTITYFPIDDKTLEYMRGSNRSPERIEIVEKYSKDNMFWREHEDKIEYTDVIELDLSQIKPTVAGPKRPQDKILLSALKDKFVEIEKEIHGRYYIKPEERENYINRWKNEGGTVKQETAAETKESDGLKSVWVSHGSEKYLLSDGSVAIAAITSCTNTSNPYVMLGAGLVARKARERGIDTKPWVKTSLAPGSKVVTDYLEKAEVMEDLEALGFHLVGYGCTTCIGNSGPLPPIIDKAVKEHNLVVASTLSGNRNFEARIHNNIKMNYLMSPMLVVAFAIAGRVDIDMTTEPISYDKNDRPVYLKDIWPTDTEIREIMNRVLSKDDFKKNYDTIFDGNDSWKHLQIPEGQLYQWDNSSTYIKEVPFFENLPRDARPLSDIKGARALLKLGESVTTDHISPAGSFTEESAAGKYLKGRGVELADFNSYGSRRGNDEVMVRGTFANVRIKNQIATKEGGYSVYFPKNEESTVFETAQKYKADGTPLIVLAGKEYGSGSSRDWAAKGTYLLGIKAVIAQSYERIHRSNLIMMGVLPLQYIDGQSAETLGLTGREIFNINGIESNITPHKKLDVTATKEDGTEIKFQAIARLDSDVEIAYYQNDGILQYVLRQFMDN